ncbi:MAG: deoxynucleoside kinase [Chloroflexota bacterium]
MKGSQRSDDKLMVLLEGNIGAGKTTVGRTIADSGHFGFIEEPTKVWREGFAANMLDLFYSDTQRWAFTFQICAFVTRAKTWHEVWQQTDQSKVILERSIYCDRYVFAENCHRTGLFSETEYQLYCGMWDFTVSQYVDEPDAILYLRAPAEVCLQRIKDRGRSEETGIPLEYLLQLEHLHDDWLLDNPKTILLNGENRWTAEEIVARIEASVR